MQVLICDDDASVRFIVRRLLEENFGCTVRECGDGVEALMQLSREKYAFAILDVEMPTMDGVETLEEIRASEATRDLPVLILSRERQEESVVKLMHLGIADYLLKPPRAHTLVSKVEKIVKMLPARLSYTVDLASVQMKPTEPALLVDGNLDYRFFFATQVERYGPLMQADSGAAAIAAIRRTPVRLVFVGSDLGVVTVDRLVHKLREGQPGGVRIVRLANSGENLGEAARLFDGVITRSYVPDVFRAALRPYVYVPGPFTALCAVVPELRDIVASATTQVFGMMFDSEIAVSHAEEPLAPDFTAVLDVELDDRFVLDIGVHLPKAAALAATSRMVGIPESDLGDEECSSVAGELGNLITGRAHARFRERSMKSVCSLPKLQQGGPFTPPSEGDGVVQRYTLPGGGDFMISLSVRDRLEEAKARSTEAA